MELMSNILLAAILVVILLQSAGAMVVFWWGYRRFCELSARVDDAEASFRQFVSPPKDGEPSPLAAFLQAFTEMLARSMVAQLKGFLMGLQSGQARAEKAVEGDLAEAAITEAQPGLGGLLGSFPALRKSLRKNPGLVDFILSRVGGGNGNNGHSESVQSPRFKFGG